MDVSVSKVVFIGKETYFFFAGFQKLSGRRIFDMSLNRNHQFETMKSNWDRLACVDFYHTLIGRLDFSKAHDIHYLKEKVVDIVGREHADKVNDYVLPAILITAYYYKSGKETIPLSNQESKDILSISEHYVDVNQLTFYDRCFYLKIADGLLTATDQTGKILEVEGIYLLNKRFGNQNAFMVYSVVRDNEKYGFQYLSFPYGNEGNLFDYYESFSEAIGLEENAFKSRELLTFALNAITYLNTKGII